MKMTLWRALGALGIAVAVVCAAPPALSSSKKAPTPSVEASAAKTSSDKAAKTEKVNLNTASEKEIAAAKGVGAKLAKALVAGRPYKTWDDVSKVKGVGTGKKLDSLKKVLKLTDGVAAKDDTAATETKGKKTKSSSKGEETSSAASGGAAAGGAAAGGAAATAGKTSASSGSPSKKSPSSSSSSSEKLAPGSKININTASAEELDKLPEIGPVKAKAIVDYREANGKFSVPEDIMKVSGIKEGTFAKIKDYIVVK